MKLTEEDKKFLREEFFEDERSILQIEKALKKTIFEIDGKRISADEAIRLHEKKLNKLGITMGQVIKKGLEET